MTPVKFDDIEIAYDYANFGEPAERNAAICKETGQIYYLSEDYDGDQEEIPDDIDDDSRYAWIPQKNDLDLGENLVFNFVSEFLPEQSDQVDGFFRKRGAYAHFKELLEKQNMLEKWFAYENTATRKALREWCEENGIPLAD